MANELQLVGFRIGKEMFGVPIELVHEIVRVPEVTAVPDALEYVEGVINLRGKIISVVDLRKRFGHEIHADRKNRILVANVEGTMVGLIVDAASEVLKMPHSEVEAPPANVFDDADVNYVTGVGKLNGRLIILLDLKKILDKGELRRLGDLIGNGEVASA